MTNQRRRRPASLHAPAERQRATGLRSVSKRAADEKVRAVYSDHRLREIRSLALHCAIVRKIDHNPALLEIPKRNLRRWRDAAGDRPPAYLAEWAQVLTRPWPEVAELLTSFSEDAVRLRQSSPFAGVLDARERKRIYEAFRA